VDQKDYYKLLGVSEEASADEIKKSYRNLAFKYHPDRAAGNEEMMKEINEAYAVLSNPVKRNEYDTLRRSYGAYARDQFRQSYSEQDIFRDSDIGQVFEEFSKIFGFSGPEDIFGRQKFYGPRYQSFKFKGPGRTTGTFFFYGPLGSAYQEGLKRHPRQSGQGTGQHPFQSWVLGMLQKMIARRMGVDLPEPGKDLHDVISLTPQGAAIGGKLPYLHRLAGNQRDILINIPQGIRSGQIVKLRGLGEPGKYGGQDGSLLIKVIVREPLIERIKAFFRRLLGWKL